VKCPDSPQWTDETVTGWGGEGGVFADERCRSVLLEAPPSLCVKSLERKQEKCFKAPDIDGFQMFGRTFSGNASESPVCFRPQATAGACINIGWSLCLHKLWIKLHVWSKTPAGKAVTLTVSQLCCCNSESCDALRDCHFVAACPVYIGILFRTCGGWFSFDIWTGDAACGISVAGLPY